MQSNRDVSLDAFRGLTVILMIIVNIQGNGDAAFAALKHAEWHGLTFADLVFPWFLFIVGLSVPLALERVHSRSPWPQVLRRSLVLFALGIILAWLIRPVEFDQIRWMGVLQRIGIVYLSCAAVVLLTRSWRIALALAVTALIAHSWLLFVTVDGINSLTEGAGLNASLDQNLLSGRLLRKTWDPEGVLSTIPAISSGLIGVAVMRFWKDGQDPIRRLLLLAAAIGLAIAGATLSKYIPINKALWTTSFVLITAGLGLLVWHVAQKLWPRIADTTVARLCVLYGQTALTLYVTHMLLLAVIVRKLPDGTRIWDFLYAKLASTGLSPPLTSLLFALIAGAICTAPLSWLKKRGWLIKA